jgi:hypothetical protein
LIEVNDHPSWAYSAVAVAWGLAGDEDASGSGASIEGLMLLAGGDLEAFAGVENVVLAVDLQG